MKLRLALVGTGHRASRFIDELLTRHRATVELVAFCDVSAVRMAAHNRWLAERHAHPPVPVFASDCLAELVRLTQPHTVIVATPDAVHHETILAALALGCDVVTEKPMTTDAAKCAAILAAVARHPARRVTVAFNYRWAPTNTRVKQLLDQGVIGPIRSVNLEWLLDRKHGADYFRRWHAVKAASGGLLVHKATHHFDLVNWWADAMPESVFASGSLAYYGRDAALARGDAALTAYPRYTDEPAAWSDPYRLDLRAHPRFRALYLDAEAESGYVRDRNVFRAGIDIEDNVAVIVRYRTGLLLTYTLNAFSPREGMRVVFNGDRGRLEYYQFEKTHAPKAENDEGHASPVESPLPAAARPLTEQTFIRVYPAGAPAYDEPALAGPGGHWGGDPLMIDHLFTPQTGPDPLGRLAGPEQGAASALVGIAANRSLATGAAVALADLVALRPEARRLSELQ